jgi:hypothetical protein
MYRPNFCAECGSRVERARWRVWSSRRFCAACERRFGKGRIIFWAVACACLVGVGFALGRAGRTHAPPLVIERRVTADGTDAEAAAAVQTDAAQTPAAVEHGPDGTDAERPTDPLEVVSICGARTQKGTPCSRRVRGMGRCWQHRGKPAILSPEKLVVQN